MFQDDQIYNPSYNEANNVKNDDETLNQSKQYDLLGFNV